MRKKAPPKVDRKIFTRTAAHSKAINLSARVYRGGTRL